MKTSMKETIGLRQQIRRAKIPPTPIELRFPHHKPTKDTPSPSPCSLQRVYLIFHNLLLQFAIPLLYAQETRMISNCTDPFPAFVQSVRKTLPVNGIWTPMATLRNLKVKTGTCKRLVKELHSYEKEVEREAAKTADMKEKGTDPYDLKQQENVLAESRMMIPDCRKRLEASLADLKGILAEVEEELNQKEGPEIEEAQTVIGEVDALFQTTEA
ncbi:hypothetical protein ACFXTH_027976 [Malus domestica]